ncbi:MAG TPA: sulfotransferase [Bryobacteraceae bacterium]|nr:sulfotransferase [Bryobacteraceae bacterium]
MSSLVNQPGSAGGDARPRVRAPVFIIGSQRSGTTLLRVTLNRHSQLAVCGETEFFRRLYTRRHAFGDPANEQNRARIVSAYLAVRPVRQLGIDLSLLEERMMREGVNWSSIFASLLSAYATTHGKPFAGEKTPGHAWHVHTLCEWYPDCAIIHLIRDPRAVVYSLTNVPWASRSVLMGARMWHSINTAALAASKRDNYMAVKYEDLVARPEQELARICRHIGLDYEEALLEPIAGQRDPDKPFHPAYQKITAGRAAVWQMRLHPWQIAAIEAAAGEYMDQFGYQRHSAGAVASGKVRAVLEAFREMGLQKMLRLPCAFFRYFRPTRLADEERWIAWASSMYARMRLQRQAGAL